MASAPFPGSGTSPGGRSPQRPAASNRRGWIWGIGCSVAALVALLPLCCCAGYLNLLDRYDDASVRVTLRHAREAGAPVTPEEMNAFYPTSPAIEQATGHWRRAMALANSPEFESACVGLPIVGENPKYQELGRIPQNDLPRAKAFLAQFDAVVQETHAARRAGAIARYPADYSLGRDLTLPDVQSTSRLFNLLHLDQQTRAQSNDAEGSVESLLTMVAVTESLQNEPVFFSQRIRAVQIATAAGTVATLIDKVELMEDQLVRLQQAFARQRFLPSLRRALRGEQYLAFRTMGGEMPEVYEDYSYHAYLPGRAPNYEKTAQWFREIFEAEEQGFLATMLAAEHVGTDATKVASDEALAGYYALTLATLPNFPIDVGFLAQGEAYARMAEMGIAMERYRLKHGEFPDSLERLVPEFLSAAPIDPHSDAPLRVVLERYGARVYSIGVNRTDEGGRHHFVEGDLVFELDDRTDKDEY